MKFITEHYNSVVNVNFPKYPLKSRILFLKAKQSSPQIFTKIGVINFEKVIIHSGIIFI